MDLLDKDSDDTIRLSVSEAQALGEKALMSIGYTPEEATIVATHLVDASMWGYEFAGLPRILVIADRPEIRKPRTPVTILRQTPASAYLDGGNQVGYIAILRAAEVAIEKARQSGVAVVGMRNSWFGGRSAYYMEKIARAGFAAIYCCSSTPTVVPPGAVRKVLGTNPMAIALPGKVNPFIFDMGTAAVMSGEVLMKAFLGEEFHEVVGIDKHGTPTRAARDMVEGGVFPFGGHKGYGLSIAIQEANTSSDACGLCGERFDLAVHVVKLLDLEGLRGVLRAEVVCLRAEVVEELVLSGFGEEFRQPFRINEAVLVTLQDGLQR